MDKWILEPIDYDDEVLGWSIVENELEDAEDFEQVAVLPILGNLNRTKDNAALISTAPELLEMCKRALTHVNKKSSLYKDLEYYINKAEGLEGDIEMLSFFDDLEDASPESVLHINFDLNKCTIVSNASMKDLFLYQEVSDEAGLINLNVSFEYSLGFEVDEYSLKYPIGDLISKHIYDEFIEYMSKKYKNLKSFMVDFDAQIDELPLKNFICDIFFDDFVLNYKRDLNLKDYLRLYPLVYDTPELYLDITLPKFLEGCPHSNHTDIEVTYNDDVVEGIIFYREKENKFFIFNQEEKSASFFMIPNVDDITSTVNLNFIDLIQLEN